MTFDVTTPQTGDGLSSIELELYHLIMDYRGSHGVAPIPLSGALTTTAGRHAADWVENIWRAGLSLPEGTNLHSWSDAPYYTDNRNPEVMWDAPERIGTGYLGDGFEISAAGYASVAATFEAWIGSPAHNDLLLSRGDWAGFPFAAIGIGVEIDPTAGGVHGGRIYHIWFGTDADATDGPPIQGGDGADDMVLTAFADAAAGGGGNDTLHGMQGDDTLLGGQGNDRLLGGAGADRIAAGGGADRLFGQAGRDTLIGGTGNDTLSGGPQDDVLIGGAGDDLLRGGEGADSFVFRGRFGADRIADFGPGDRVSIRGPHGVQDAEALSGALSQTAVGVLYDARGDGAHTILFAGLTLDDLTPDMFGL